jgi:hypothetical protein
MIFNDLLKSQGIPEEQVLVLRHRPPERKLRNFLPGFAEDEPELFNAYQQTQRPTVERMIERLKGKGYTASFIGLEPGKAWFVGLYKIVSSKPLTYEQFWAEPTHAKLKTFGMDGWTNEAERSAVLWFDLELTDFYRDWKGKLVIGWTPPERSWCRRAHRNSFPILSILEESAFSKAMPHWRAINLTWQQLHGLPSTWRAKLHEWRGIYYIFDTSDDKGYVGSASGESNLLGRWLDYAASGHGGNRLLRRPRNPENFQFTILQRLSPDLAPAKVIRVEGTWKDRLHTRHPHGLNEN